jgi:hypothetical protein
MRRSSDHPTVHVGKVWRLMLADLGLNAMAVLRRAGLPSGLLDGDGSRITLDDSMHFGKALTLRRNHRHWR